MMKKILVLFLLMIIITSGLFAEKSKFKAALFSALVPGTGEVYARAKTSGYISLTAEAFLWLGYLGCQQQAEWIEDDFKQFAYIYANTKITNGSEQYYDLIQDFSSSEEYNNNVYIYARYYLNHGWTEDEYNEFLDINLYQGNEAWEWQDSDKQLHFGELRRDRNQFNIISRFTVGAMVINRIVSVIKAVRAAHVHNNDLEASQNISFNFDYNPVSQQVKVYFSKKF